MSTMRRRSSRSWMQGISRMRLPMSAKLPAICAILSANGLGMKCVHASMRIIGGPPTFLLMPRREAGRASSGVKRALGGQRARGMAAPRLSRPRGLFGWRTGARGGGLDSVAYPHELHGKRLELLGVVPARAHQTLVHGLFLALHLLAGRREADPHATFVVRVA